MRIRSLIAAFLLAACSSAPTEVQLPRHPPDGPQILRPKIRIHTERLSPSTAKLTVMATNDVDISPRNYKIEWRRDGQVATWAGPGTQATVAAIEHSNGVWFPETESTQRWQATLLPTRRTGFTLAATATTTVTLVAPCRTNAHVESTCDAVPYQVATTQALPNDASAARRFLADQTAQHFFPAATGAVHARAERYFSILMMQEIDTDPATPIDYDPATYTYRPEGKAGYEPYAVFDRMCGDIALVGAACYNAFLTDVDNDPTQSLAAFSPPGVTFSVGRLEAAWIVTVDLQLDLDVLMEPPSDATISDVPNDTANPAYDPAADLSTYLKAFGRAGVALHAVFEIDTSTPKILYYRPRALAITEVTSVALQRGPFCHNNLGSVYGATVTFPATHARPVSLSPPFVTGVPLFPGLVSDTDSAGVLLNYYAREQGTYPHTVSSPNGGSGAGRDALGVGTRAFAYGSDNPNNCRRPADACTVSGMQDGGILWSGVSASCQYPNVSDDGDDATYRITTQLVPGITLCLVESCASAAEIIGGRINYALGRK